MNRIGISCLLTFCLGFVPQTASPRANPQEEVEAAIAAFDRAFRAADVAALDALLTEGYVHINGRSGALLSRAEWLRWVGSRRAALDSGELVIESYEVRQLSIRMYERAAVVTGEVESSGLRDGSPFSSVVRFSNFWVLDGGRWRRAAFHDTPVGE